MSIAHHELINEERRVVRCGGNECEVISTAHYIQTIPLTILIEFNLQRDALIILAAAANARAVHFKSDEATAAF